MKLMHTVLKNILEHPGEDKYCKLKLSNERINKYISKNKQAVFLFEMIGFDEMLVCPQNSVKPEPHMVLNGLRCDM